VQRSNAKEWGQLRRYDADAIARMYRFQPWLILGRAIKIVFLFLSFLIGWQMDASMGKSQGNQQERAEQLRNVLTTLGPTYIKVGQALSTRPDLIRQDFLDELIKLQDQLPPFPTPIAFNIIEAELGRSMTQIYREISPQPIAAASLGQVYKAKLHTGEEVAVKVQRPNLYPLISA
jgi:predicted unusual protein kinase regulating ubiquinone biosynthesis (AarF/ABC1/UbiB family)